MSAACPGAGFRDNPIPLKGGLRGPRLGSAGPPVPRPGDRPRLGIGSRADPLRGDISHDHPRFDTQAPPYFSRDSPRHGPETYVELRRVSDRATACPHLKSREPS